VNRLAHVYGTIILRILRNENSPYER
jgi:hypothetical protein